MMLLTSLSSNRICFPQCGQGTLLLLTYSLYTTKIKNILKNRPKLLEFSPLTPQEGLLMCEDSFDSIDMIPKPDMLDLINYFELTPAHVASAITVINCMRNQSFLEIGPREYLNKLTNTSQLAPKGHSTPGTRLSCSEKCFVLLPIFTNAIVCCQRSKFLFQ
jgi:hypothetical protein